MPPASDPARRSSRGRGRHGPFPDPARPAAPHRRHGQGRRRRLARRARRARHWALLASRAPARRRSALRVLRLIRSQGPIVYLGQPHRRLTFEGDAAAAARHADRLSGPLRLAVAAPVGRRYRRGGAHRPGHAAQPMWSGARSSPRRWPIPASIRRRWTAIRTNFPAASASASRSRGPWCWSRNSSCSTSRPRRSICRCRRRSSISCANCSEAQPRLSLHQP